MPLVDSAVSGLLKTYAHVAPTERGAYQLVRAARTLIPRQRWTLPRTTPDNLSMTLDLGVYPDCCMAFGLYELHTYRLLKSLQTPGMHFVDCGANLGYFTLLAARWVGETGKVDAFEPDPINRA